MSDSPLADLPPEIQQIVQLTLTTFVKENLPSIYIIIVASLWLGVSLSLLMALLYSSTSRSRRKPLFVLCIIAVGFGSIPSILFLKLLVQTFIGTENLSFNLVDSVKPYVFALGFFSFLSSFCVDCILLFRLRAVFPPSRLSRSQLAARFGPLLAIKLGRIVAIVLLIVNFAKKSRTLPSDDPTNLYMIIITMPEPIAAWTLQLVDNVTCSVLFLWQLHRWESFSSRLSKGSFAKRLRALFLIAFSNMALPVIFVIIELALMTNNRHGLQYDALAAISIAGTNIEVIGVLFATIWAQAVEWKSDAESGTVKEGELSLSFATRPGTFYSTRQTGTGTEHGQTSTTGRTTTTGVYSIGEGSNVNVMDEKNDTRLA